MKKCQLMIYGGKHHWIDVSHRKNPEIEHFIFIGAPHKDEKPPYWEDIHEKISQLEEQQKDYPDSEKITYNYLEVDFENKIVEYIRYFNELIQYLSERKTSANRSPSYEQVISCNITAGIFEMQIALFIAAQLNPDSIYEIFYINKQNFEKNLLLIDLSLPKYGKRILSLLGRDMKTIRETTEGAHVNNEYNLTELLTFCIEDEIKIDLPGLSRLVNKLRKKGYLVERRDGREKFLSITDIGRVYLPSSRFREAIRKQLDTKDK